jgi:integrase
VDWAEDHHDVHVSDGEGRRLAKARLPEGVDGIARFHDLVGGHVEEPAEVVIGIETDRGLFVTALVAAGYQLYAVNPMSTSRYRDRHSASGAKSDAELLGHTNINTTQAYTASAPNKNAKPSTG